MSAQEKAGIRALARHTQKTGIRDGQIHCVCEWKTQTMGQANQQKSFRRHQIREVLAATWDTDEAAATRVRELHSRVWHTWTELDGTPGEGWICDHCTPTGRVSVLTLHPCPTIDALGGSE